GLPKPPDRGQSLLEFALVLPALLLMVMGIFDLGWAVYAQNSIALAAREGARTGIITTRPDSMIRAQVKNTAQGLALTDDDITIDPVEGAGPWFRPRGGKVTVTVRYNFVPVTPLIGNIVGVGGSIPLVADATMYVE
ncbi:MAG: TadE/TadG family type IV pilus assembly protein, partial [Rudaea sp.]